MKIDFLIRHIQTTVSFLSIALTHPFLPRFLLQKGAGFQETKTKCDKRRYSKRRWNPSYWSWTRQPNKRKEVHEQIKLLEISQLSLFQVPQKYQTYSPNVCAEDLVQTHACPVLANVSLCEPCLIDSVCQGLLASSFPFDSSNNFSPQAWISVPHIQREKTDGYLQFRLSLYKCLAFSFINCANLLPSEPFLMKTRHGINQRNITIYNNYR